MIRNPVTKSLSSEKRKKEIIHVYVLLFSMCIVVALLTYVIPAGSYERESVDGRTVVVADSYQVQESTPVGIFGLFNSVSKGWDTTGFWPSPCHTWQIGRASCRERV